MSVKEQWHYTCDRCGYVFDFGREHDGAAPRAIGWLRVETSGYVARNLCPRCAEAHRMFMVEKTQPPSLAALGEDPSEPPEPPEPTE